MLWKRCSTRDVAREPSAVRGITYMGQGIWRRTVAFMLATAVALTLTGCEVGGIDLPIDLPFDLPFTLPTIHVPEDIPTPAALIESATNERSLEESLRMRQHEPTLVAPTIRQDGVLTVGIKTTQEMAPLYLFDETTREISGYDIDVAVVPIFKRPMPPCFMVSYPLERG